MSLAIFPSRIVGGPQGPQTINWGHPLAQYLVGCVIATPAGLIELVTGRYLQKPTSSSLPTYVTINGFAGAKCGANIGATMLASPNVLRTSGLTVFSRFLFTATPAGNSELFGVYYDAVASSPYECCAIQTNSAGGMAGGTNNGSLMVLPPVSAVAPIIGKPQTYSFHASSLGATLIGDSVRQVETAGPSAISFSTSTIAVGDSRATGVSSSLIFDIGYIWAGPQMKGIDLLWLHSEPHTILTPLKNRRYFVLPSATSVSIPIPAGTLTITGQLPISSLLVSGAIPLGALSLSGLSPNLRTGFGFNIPIGTLSYSGLNPTINKGPQIFLLKGSLSVSGLAPIDNVNFRTSIDSVNLSITGKIPKIGLSVTDQAKRQWTTNKLFHTPEVFIFPASSTWVWSNWIQVSITTASWLVSGLVVHPPSSGTVAEAEFDIGIGAEGFEVPIDRFRGCWVGTEFTSPGILPRPILLNAIGVGRRVAIRMRKRNSETVPWGVVLDYYKKPLVGVMKASSQTQKTFPDGAQLFDIPNSALNWANDANWTELIANVPVDMILTGVICFGTTSINGNEWELDFGVGPASFEQRIVTVRWMRAKVHVDGPLLIPFYIPVDNIPQGSRLSARARHSDFNARTASIAFLYMEKPL